MPINQQLLLSIVLLLSSILLFSFTSLDETVQNNFFNFQTQSWILSKHTQPYHLIFYNLPKIAIIIFSLSILITLLFFKHKDSIQKYKKGLLLTLLSTIFIPLIVSGLKKETNIPCPKNLVEYGSIYPKTYVWESYTSAFQNKKKIRCWPAGHASGGFALLSLFFIFSSLKNRVIGLMIGLGMGWSMGIYKMLIGDHFLSHTVITMLLSWIIILLLYKVIYHAKG